MSLAEGRLTCRRYKIANPEALPQGREALHQLLLDRLDEYKIREQWPDPDATTRMGWARPDDPFSTDFAADLNTWQIDRWRLFVLRIDTRKRRASIGERWVTLPPIQYRLLLALAQHEGEVVGCQELLRIVWGFEAEEAEARELVKVHIRQIRRRLGLDPEKHHYIQSIRGFGYMLSPPDES